MWFICFGPPATVLHIPTQKSTWSLYLNLTRPALMGSSVYLDFSKDSWAQWQCCCFPKALWWSVTLHENWGCLFNQREPPPRSAPGIYLPNCVIILCGWQDPKDCICLFFFFPSGVDVRPILLVMLLFTEEKIELQTSCREQSCLGKTMVERYSQAES